jgi:hypothetical protein
MRRSWPTRGCCAMGGGIYIYILYKYIKYVLWLLSQPAMTKLGLNVRQIVMRFLTRSGYFVLQSVQTGPGAHPASYSEDIAGSVPGGNVFVACTTTILPCFTIRPSCVACHYLQKSRSLSKHGYYHGFRSSVLASSKREVAEGRSVSMIRYKGCYPVETLRKS